MANQRMYLACEICFAKEETTFDECVQYLTKYYPNSGWLDDVMLENVKKFFKNHDHRTLHGKYVRIIYDSEMYQFSKERDQILQTVSDALASI